MAHLGLPLWYAEGSIGEPVVLGGVNSLLVLLCSNTWVSVSLIALSDAVPGVFVFVDEGL